MTWIRKSPAADAPPAERTWEIDGFLLAEDAARWTILDADQIARKVERKPAEWTATIAARRDGKSPDAAHHARHCACTAVYEPSWNIDGASAVASRNVRPLIRSSASCAMSPTRATNWRASVSSRR